ncbi:MAG: hypothetical protein AB2821_15005 [Candidatus Thiodiazotropha endolucinida]
MTFSFQAQIEIPASAFPPDPWTKGTRLPLDHVISRHLDGTPASTVGDYQWNWDAYKSRGRNGMFNFIYWSRGAVSVSSVVPGLNEMRLYRIHEMQHLMTLLIYKRNGIPLSSSTLEGYLTSLVRIAQFAETRSITVSEVFENPKHLDALILTSWDTAAATLFRWWNLLSKLDEQHIGIKLTSLANLEDLRKRADDHKQGKKQKAPLPTRIYSDFINGLTTELDAIEPIVEELVTTVQQLAEERNSLPSVLENSDKGVITKRLRFLRDSWSPALHSYYEFRGYSTALNALNSVLCDIQRVCKLAIHTFTGMRSAEAAYLPFHCVEIENGRHGNQHIVLVGITTKLEGGNNRRTHWVTNQIGHRAVKIAQRVASAIYGPLGLTPESKDAVRDEYPLFASPSKLPWGASPNPQVQPTSDLSLNSASNHLKANLKPIIQDADISELEQIDPHREWRNEAAFNIGQPWPLETHQLRRSLALYAQRSGLVAISSLRRQLQHITKEMSQYYARGSQFARNFIEDDPDDYSKHICKEWRDTMGESAGLAYLRDVIFADEPLLGGAGNFIEQQKRRGAIVPRDEMMRRFKKGIMSYKANPLGGCTNPDDCKSEGKGLSFLDIPCLEDGCKHLVAKRSNIVRIIPYQQKLVEALRPDSVEYSMEKRELDVLLSVAQSSPVEDTNV